ncbi:MAG: amidohydrolase family protein [bacterium]|nr:amidohydrolase family protein [bacterium]
MIDAHAHLGKWYNFYYDGGDFLSMVKIMDRIGMEFAWISALIGIGPDYELGNEMVFEAMNAFPDRFKGYVTLSPYFAGKMEDELKKRASQGFIGIKLHPGTHLYPIDGVNYLYAYKYADEHRWPILIHTWGERDVRTLIEVAKSYQNAIFIMGHSGGDLKSMLLAVDLAKNVDNVYLDLTGSAMYNGIIEYYVERIGSDRILFGTDFPFIDPRPAIGWVKGSKISEGEKLNILKNNAKRILNSAK